MKNSLRLLSLTFAGLTLLTACEPKNEPRWEHEGAKTWTATVTPDKADVTATSFNDYDLQKGFLTLREGDGKDLTTALLIPLSQFVLNKEFIEKPMYRTVRMAQMISIFNAAFVQEYNKNPRSSQFQQIKDAYYNTVFAGCTPDLRRDCVNANIFSNDGRNTEIMTMLARELDPQIDQLLKTTGSPANCIASNDQCRNLVEERYRRLTMGVYKRTIYTDNDFAFAYLKYARLFSTYLEDAKARAGKNAALYQNMSTSYLTQVHTQIFETLIAKYKPKDINDPEFRTFVENFNPWGYSHKQADVFQAGTGKMFELGAQCCLYKDKSKTELNQSVRDAIRESQANKDAFGLSFTQVVADIRKEHPDIFTKLGMSGLISEIERPNGAFFNEYFFMVDRLFRGHLTTDEVGMMLKNTNPVRTRTELPKMISNYVKVYMVYMVVETNRFMSGIYTKYSSDQIFEQAVIMSREITGRWYMVQQQIDMLDKLMNSYFKDSLIESQEYDATFNLLRAVNRNIHYISAYPNMITMTYFLAKAKADINFMTWWGPIQVHPETVVKSMFDGTNTDVWFRFGKNVEPPDRLMMLYSIEYLLSTDSLAYFVDKDTSGQSDVTERQKFFDMLFTKYLGDSIQTLKREENEYENGVYSNENFSSLDEICGYERSTAPSASSHVTINFLDLPHYTYGGLGDFSYNHVLMQFLTDSTTSAEDLLLNLESRRDYVAAMIDVIEGDLLRTGAIKKAGDPHPDLALARKLLKDLDDAQMRLQSMFVTHHKSYFDCMMRLHEVERRRVNRLYDEERAFLGQVYDLMKPLADITDDKVLDSKVAEINASFFNKANGFALDKLVGRNYRMSQYDLLMRMKKRIESDVFVNPTDKERQVYGASLAAYNKPRSVTVDVPDGIERQDMFAQGTATTVTFGNSRDAFIDQGMKALSGKAGSFIDWQSQMDKDYESMKKYFVSLREFYVMTPTATGDASLVVTPKDLTDAYLKVMAAYTMDAFDIQNAKSFGIYGHQQKPFFSDIYFEKDGTTRLPLFFYLMDSTVKTAAVDLDSPGVIYEAIDFAKRINSLQAFVFDPSPVVKTTTYNIYGSRAHARMNRVSELFTYISDLSKNATDAKEIDPRFAQPLYLENSELTYWYQSGVKNLIDNQRFTDQRVRIANFIQRTGNYFNTKEKVQSP